MSLVGPVSSARSSGGVRSAGTARSARRARPPKPAVPTPGRSAGASARHGRGARTPIVVAHRGASAFRPEHTLLSYEVAIQMGADYIEPDLVSTKDHVLVSRHENELSATTDVADHFEFAARRTTKTINGGQVTGWFTEDFTLAELRTLRARERFPKRRPGNAAYDGQAQIPTLEEIVKLAQKHGVGIYPEIKYPTYFASIGLPIEEPLLEVLRRYGWDEACDPVFIQSFETSNLKRLRALTRLRLIQLIGSGSGAPYDLVDVDNALTCDELVTSEGLRQIATYADGIGVTTTRIVPVGPDGRTDPPTSLVRDAHRYGLQVHVSTIRDENAKLPAEYRRGRPGGSAYRRAVGDVTGWLKRLYRLRVDGVFADNPGVARVTRDRMFGGD
ncbi:glycerophosphodiester phosphodiesterase [Streptosporangium sp. NPDC003464]